MQARNIRHGARKVVSCNVPADKQHEAPSLCGLTNIQGRNVNGDANECRDGVDQGTGGFPYEAGQDFAKTVCAELVPSRMTSCAKRLVEAFKAPVRPSLKSWKGLTEEISPGAWGVPG